MSTRGLNFFLFVKEFADIVSKTLIVKDHIPWSDLPGYMTIVKGFLLELKKKEV